LFDENIDKSRVIINSEIIDGFIYYFKARISSMEAYQTIISIYPKMNYKKKFDDAISQLEKSIRKLEIGKKKNEFLFSSPNDKKSKDFPFTNIEALMYNLMGWKLRYEFEFEGKDMIAEAKAHFIKSRKIYTMLSDIQRAFQIDGRLAELEFITTKNEIIKNKNIQTDKWLYLDNAERVYALINDSTGYYRVQGLRNLFQVFEIFKTNLVPFQETKDLIENAIKSFHLTKQENYITLCEICNLYFEGENISAKKKKIMSKKSIWKDKTFIKQIFILHGDLGIKRKAIEKGIRKIGNNITNKIKKEPPISKEKEFISTVGKMISLYKHEIENKNGYKLLWLDSEPRYESYCQIFFENIIEQPCDELEIVVSRETTVGTSGDVDFKFSKGRYKTIVELKRGQNSKLKDGLNEQVPAYMKDLKIKTAFYVIVCFKDNHLKRIQPLETDSKNIETSKGLKIYVIGIDSRKKRTSASKRKKK
jgi:hypothetical protein